MMPRTKKHLGQHFLAALSHVRAVADAGRIVPGETVLEIGPGRGVLTQELLARGAKVIAVEKDRELLPILRERFARELEAKDLSLIEDDALELDRAGLGLQEGEYKVIANIPYYITGALLESFLAQAPRPGTLVFLVQKEVAERIAKSSKESLLSLSVKAYGTPLYMRTVPAGAFSPPPSVDSAILQVRDISRGNFKTEAEEKHFFKLLHAGFGHKRKLLRSNLKGLASGEALERSGIASNARAEDIPLSQWLLLGKNAREA